MVWTLHLRIITIPQLCSIYLGLLRYTHVKKNSGVEFYSSDLERLPMPDLKIFPKPLTLSFSFLPPNIPLLFVPFLYFSPLSPFFSSFFLFFSFLPLLLKTPPIILKSSIRNFILYKLYCKIFNFKSTKDKYANKCLDPKPVYAYCLLYAKWHALDVLNTDWWQMDLRLDISGY